MDSSECDARGKPMHLIIDGQVGNRRLLCEPEDINSWLVKATGEIGMKVIDPPRSVWYGGDESSGVSACVFLAESSISLHSFPEYSYIFLDLFSCRRFDVGRVVGMIESDFEMSNPRALLLDRGIDTMGQELRVEKW